jgi:hypothetical protein
VIIKHLYIELYEQLKFLLSEGHVMHRCVHLIQCVQSMCKNYNVSYKMLFQFKRITCMCNSDKEEFLYNISICTQLMIQFFWDATFCHWMSD